MSKVRWKYGMPVCKYLYVHLTWHSGGHGAAQGGDSCHGDLLRAVLFGAGVSSGHHVGFEQCALQIDVVVRQRLVDSCQYLRERERERDDFPCFQSQIWLCKDRRMKNIRFLFGAPEW